MAKQARVGTSDKGPLGPIPIPFGSFDNVGSSCLARFGLGLGARVDVRWAALALPALAVSTTWDGAIVGGVLGAAAMEAGPLSFAASSA